MQIPSPFETIWIAKSNNQPQMSAIELHVCMTQWKVTFQFCLFSTQGTKDTKHPVVCHGGRALTFTTQLTHNFLSTTATLNIDNVKALCCHHTIKWGLPCCLEGQVKAIWAGLGHLCLISQTSSKINVRVGAQINQISPSLDAKSTETQAIKILDEYYSRWQQNLQLSISTRHKSVGSTYLRVRVAESNYVCIIFLPDLRLRCRRRGSSQAELDPHKYSMKTLMYYPHSITPEPW